MIAAICKNPNPYKFRSDCLQEYSICKILLQTTSTTIPTCLKTICLIWYDLQTTPFSFSSTFLSAFQSFLYLVRTYIATLTTNIILIDVSISLKTLTAVSIATAFTKWAPIIIHLGSNRRAIWLYRAMI